MTTKRDIHQPIRRPLSSDELADLTEAFDACDANGDQRIDVTEFSQLLENLGSDIPAAQRRARFDAIDLNHDGTIDRGEFVEWWCAQ
jgi:Ca2+-binding EF-hand superfamily protein